jgi:hypothetical protein
VTRAATSPFVYFVDARLSYAELTAACLDGDLVGLGDGFVPADVVESVWLRAASLSTLLGDTLAASHATAAWVHGGVDDPPARHSVQRAVPYRLHHVFDRRLDYHDGALDAVDLVHPAGVAVTTPGRTIADLARSTHPDAADAVRAWIRRDADVAAQGLAWLAGRTRLPHRRRAEALLRSRPPDPGAAYTS